MANYKRILGISAYIIAIIVAVAVVLWGYIGQVGSTGLEDWIGKQIIGVIETHITPKVSFDSIDYQAPRTVVVENLSLTAKGHAILRVDQMVLELAEIPRRDEPLRIQRVELREPHVQFLAASSGGFLGWSNFVKPEVSKNPQSVPKGQRLSDVLVLRHVSIRDGEIRYEDQRVSGEPMVLPGINMTLRTLPIEGDPGWYALSGTFERDPVFRVDLDGRINLDTALLRLARLTLNAALGPQQYQTLPPQVQHILRRHEIRGALTASVEGEVPLNQPAEAIGRVQATLDNAHFAYAGLTVPVKQIALHADLPDGGVTLTVTGIALKQDSRPVVSIEQVAALASGIPKPGEALHIERITVDRPSVLLGGVSALWKQAKSTAARPPAPAAGGSSIDTVTHAVVLDRLEINDAAIGYAAAGREYQVGGIDVGVTTARKEGALDVNASITRKPFLDGKVSARLHPDTNVLDVQSLDVRASVKPAEYNQIPAEARQFAEGYNIQGEIHATGSGSIPFDEPAQATGRAKVDARNLGFTYAGLSVPIKEAQAEYDATTQGVSVTVAGFTLLAGDTKILAFDRASAQIAGLVPPERQLRIEVARFERPSLAFLPSANGGYAGWRRLSADAGEKESTASALTGLADRVALDQLEIEDASVSFGPAVDRQPIVVSGINAQISALPAQTDSAYKIAGRVDIKPMLTATFNGQLPLDTLVAKVDQFKLDATIDEQTSAKLPPAMQKTLERYGVKGTVSVRFEGTLPLESPTDFSGRLVVDASHASITVAHVAWPADELHVEAQTSDGSASIRGKNLRALSGDEMLMAIEGLNVDLTGLSIKAHRPIEIQRLQVTSPTARLVQTEDGRFVGWSDLADYAVAHGKAQQRQTGSAASADSLLSKIVLHNATLSDGKLVYAEGGAAEPMILPGIDVSLRMPPIPEEAGWYRLVGEAKREPLISIQADGRVNINEALVDMKECRIRADLNDQQYQTLPPQAQAFLRNHEIRGQLRVLLSGRIPVADPFSSRIKLKVNLKDARLALADTVWPVERFQLTADSTNRSARALFDGRLLGGDVQGTATMEFQTERPVKLQWQLSGIQIEAALRASGQGEPKYAGTLQSRGSLAAELRQLPSSLRGSGWLKVTDGRLVDLPVIHHIVDLLAKTRLKVDSRKDRAVADFTVKPDCIHLTDAKVNCSFIAILGEGNIYYDKRLDLQVKADMLEKLRNRLGKVGEVIGNLTKKAVSYEVHGTVSDPKLVVKPLGIRIDGLDGG